MAYGLFGRLIGFLSVHFWGRLPSKFQLRVSRFLSRLSHLSVSRYFIPVYCFFQYKDSQYFKKFRPGNGAEHYRCFQDFFTRDLIKAPNVFSDFVWPCEGLLCDIVQVGSNQVVSVKGESKHVRTIFGSAGQSIPDHYHFANVFLHNNNYHNIHAPVSGFISRIEHIPGDLLFLRPWAYRNKPSLPAFCNERVNIDIIDNQTNQKWFLSIVGGPLVATIRLVEKLKIGAHFTCGEKLGGFLMGSTCCVAAPRSPKKVLNSQVFVGEEF